jgi:hypothetical protein
MNKTAPAEFDEVLARVTAWPPDDRVELARKVLDTVHPANGAGGVTQPTADEVINTMRTRYPLLAAAPALDDLRARLLPLIGLASAGKPPPSDADIKQWIDEQRRAKYG